METRELELLSTARRGVLATVRPDGSPRVLPVCFVVEAPEPPEAPEEPDAAEHVVIYSPIDEKPKASADPRALARVRDLLERPRVTLMVDRWDENWSGLAWIQLRGRAALVEPGAAEHGRAVERLRGKYEQYERHALGARPIIRIEVESVRSWFAVLPYVEPL